MFEMNFCGAEEVRLVLLEVHLLGAGDEPGVVEVAGFAEVEAAFLPGERGDVRTGDDGEADESEKAGGGDSGGSVFLPEDDGRQQAR